MASRNVSAAARPGRGRHRRWIAGAAAALLLVAGGYTLLWFEAVRAVTAGIDTWAAERRTAGWFVAWDGLTVRGFPLAFRVRLDNPVAGEAAAETWSWRADALDIAAAPWASRQLRYGATRGSFAWARRGEPRTLLFESPLLSGTITVRDRAPDSLTVRLQAPVLELQGLAAPITAGTLDLALRRLAEAGVALDARFAASALDGPLDALDRMGGVIDRLAAEIVVSGPVPASGPLRDRVTAWRDGGGTIEARALQFHWGPLHAEGDGTLTLDEAMRPLGAFGTRLRGLSEFIDQLVRAGLINSRTASAVKISVGLLAARDASGVLAVPVSAQFGKLSVGPVVVADLPPLALD